MTAESRGAPPARYLLEWLVPALFALLLSATVRFHSLALVPTMPRMVGNLLALAAVALLVLGALGRRLNPPRDVALLLLPVAAAATVSVLGSGDADISLLRLELYLAMALLAIVFHLLHRDATRLPLEGYFLCIGLVHLPFLVGAVLWIRALDVPFGVYGPRISDFAHIRQFGELGFFAAVSGTALGVLSRPLLLPSFLLGAIAVFGIALTGSRGALLSWIIFVVLLCCLSRARLRAALLGLTTLVASTVVVWYLDASGLLPSPNIFGRLEQIKSAAGQNFDSGRIDLWIASIKQIVAHPFFGSGPEGYWISRCCDLTVMQAHNFVLQFLLEFGLIGCGTCALLLARVAAHRGGFAGLRRLALATPANRVLVCLLASYCAYSLIDQTMYHLVPLLNFALFAGLFSAGLAQASAAAAALVSPRREL